jgi:hypothetical protein
MSDKALTAPRRGAGDASGQGASSRIATIRVNGIAATRITLTDGTTVVVSGTVAEVKAALAGSTGAEAAHLHPVSVGGEAAPGVMAIKPERVQHLTDATPWEDQS